MRKGQFNIEYLVSLAIFIVILIFVSVQVSRVVPEVHGNSVSEQLDAKAFRITDTLIKSKGEPEDWEFSSPSAIGLSTGEYYVLDDEKIDSFNSICSVNYNVVRDIFGFKPGSDFRITILRGNDIAVDCGQREPSNVIRTVVRRHAVNESGTSVDIVLSVW